MADNDVAVAAADRMVKMWETFREIDTYLAQHCFGRTRDTWPKDADGNAYPPETSNDTDGRLELVTRFALNGCRAASTYDGASYGTMVTVDVLSRTGKRTIWLNGELALEPAMYALAYLFMCDKIDVLRHFSDMIEANVATQRFRLEFAVAGPPRGQPEGDREIIPADEAKDI